MSWLKEKFEHWFNGSWIVLIIAVIFAAGLTYGGYNFVKSFSYSEDAQSDKGSETAVYFLNSLNAGERDGYADCENHRGRGATFNINGWEADQYRDGYDSAYRQCESGRKAYAKGLDDGRIDCRDDWKYGGAYHDSFDDYSGSGDYANGYERGFRSC